VITFSAKSIKHWIFFLAEILVNPARRTLFSIVAKMYHSTGGVLGVLRVLRACCGPKFLLLI